MKRRIRVVTVAREFGSGGANIAALAAERLGWKLINNALITEVARAANVNPEAVIRCDERVDSWLHRVMKGLWHGGYEGVATSTPPEASTFDADTMARLSRCVIEEAAAMGDCVIVGRGGQCILQAREDTFHVFIYAPWQDKVQRVRGRSAPDTDAEALILETDRARSVYIRRYFEQDWGDRHLYDLMVSSHPGEQAVVSMILEAVRLSENRPQRHRKGQRRPSRTSIRGLSPSPSCSPPSWRCWTRRW